MENAGVCNFGIYYGHFGIFNGHLVMLWKFGIFPSFWYIVSRKIWQT
jgi:hypothetical protein